MARAKSMFAALCTLSLSLVHSLYYSSYLARAAGVWIGRRRYIASAFTIIFLGFSDQKASLNIHSRTDIRREWVHARFQSLWFTAIKRGARRDQFRGTKINKRCCLYCWKSKFTYVFSIYTSYLTAGTVSGRVPDHLSSSQPPKCHIPLLLFRAFHEALDGDGCGGGIIKPQVAALWSDSLAECSQLSWRRPRPRPKEPWHINQGRTIRGKFGRGEL
jgi:hypothetical protein